MWIIWLLFGILGWLLLGFTAFVIAVKMDGSTKVDNDIKELFGGCLLLGVFSFLVTLWLLIAEVYSDKFLNWLLNLINGERELPEKYDITFDKADRDYDGEYEYGWNACLDEILGE